VHALSRIIASLLGKNKFTSQVFSRGAVNIACGKEAGKEMKRAWRTLAQVRDNDARVHLHRPISMPHTFTRHESLQMRNKLQHSAYGKQQASPVCDISLRSRNKSQARSETPTGLSHTRCGAQACPQEHIRAQSQQKHCTGSACQHRHIMCLCSTGAPSKRASDCLLTPCNAEEC